MAIEKNCSSVYPVGGHTVNSIAVFWGNLNTRLFNEGLAHGAICIIGIPVFEFIIDKPDSF
jgi:hypothetical protein